MSVAKVSATCPFCKESILEGATKCKHCQSDLSELKRKKKSYFARFNTFKFGFLFGLILVTVLELVIYFRFFFHK